MGLTKSINSYVQDPEKVATYIGPLLPAKPVSMAISTLLIPRPKNCLLVGVRLECKGRVQRCILFIIS